MIGECIEELLLKVETEKNWRIKKIKMRRKKRRKKRKKKREIERGIKSFINILEIFIYKCIRDVQPG